MTLRWKVQIPVAISSGNRQGPLILAGRKTRLMSRSVMGAFHSISKKHLPLYLAEFDFRWNTRKDSDTARTIAGLKKASGKRLMHKQLTKLQNNS